MLIGLLGGTFDPVHLGHLRAALEIYQRLPLQEVRFIPCQQPVHKAPAVATAEHRLAMLRIALSDHPMFSIDERELHRSTPSYMIETIESMRQEDPDTPFGLILGMDALADFCTWKRWENILDLTHLVVAFRPGDFLLPKELKHRLCIDPEKLRESRGGSIFLQTTTTLDISSTRIRSDMKEKVDCSYLLPEAVYQYIREEGLYK